MIQRRETTYTPYDEKMRMKNQLQFIRNVLEYARTVAYQQITLRLPPDLAEALVESAREKGVSINAFLVGLIAENCKQTKAANSKDDTIEKINANRELQCSFLWFYYNDEDVYRNVPDFQAGKLYRVLLQTPILLEKAKTEGVEKIIQEHWKKLPNQQRKLWREAIELWDKTVYNGKTKTITFNDLAYAYFKAQKNIDEVSAKDLAKILWLNYNAAYKLFPIFKQFYDEVEYDVMDILASIKLLKDDTYEIPENKRNGLEPLKELFNDIFREN